MIGDVSTLTYSNRRIHVSVQPLDAGIDVSSMECATFSSSTPQEFWTTPHV
ncbi:hypothetical protein DCAR_0207805 [Daucus carota subsp. sativus]|uniref:Uncharacterized protein n=1 Tax=Daucus carota subsp. sativus TaxID=79200 RepID=A0A166E4A8_DAUCS|nr:hypothetical protein DCAR_0207805 [Daucus carota subsp. sativus]